jgi:tetratricopeptide (TPR) repeat protein
MPSHIYVKTGHWNQAIVQNEKSIASDDRYRRLSPDQGLQHMYMVHNSHMLAYAAMMSGREKEAMTAARSMWEDIPEEVLPMFGAFIDLWMCSPYDVQKRFGRWDAILAERSPSEHLPITTAVWHAHRAVAYASKKEFVNAEREYVEFRKAKDAIPEDLVFGLDTAHRILEVSDSFIAGEIALQKGNYQRAAELLEKAVEVEDALSYGEPPQWLQPARHTLGAVYMKDRKYAQAERVYRDDLKKWRNNGWSLYGLSRALEAQGKTAEAAEYRAQYESVWSDADQPTTTSCLCIPDM